LPAKENQPATTSSVVEHRRSAVGYSRIVNSGSNTSCMRQPAVNEQQIVATIASHQPTSQYCWAVTTAGRHYHSLVLAALWHPCVGLLQWSCPTRRHGTAYRATSCESDTP